MTVIPFPQRGGGDDEQPSKEDERDDLIPGTNSNIAYPSYAHAVDNEAVVSEDEWKRDAVHLRTNELRRKYPRAFSSFTNLHGRAKNGLAIVHEDFQTFGSFFAHMGPRKSKELTLDRIDPHNPEYGPGLCRWANPQEQARNRRSTTFLTHPETGERQPLVHWAEVLGVPASRLRRQLKDAWTPEEIFAQRRFLMSTSRALDADRWPWKLTPEQLQSWERQYKSRRQAATPTGFEFRYEFAVRALKELRQQDNNWIGDTWERYGWPGNDGREYMPAETREEFDLRTNRQAKIEERLSAAIAGEAAWRREIEGTPRPRMPFDREDREG